MRHAARPCDERAGGPGVGAAEVRRHARRRAGQDLRGGARSEQRHRATGARHRPGQQQRRERDVAADRERASTVEGA
jgi:hypothetical protein